MISLLLMLVAGTPAQPNAQPDMVKCASVEIEVYRGMKPSDFDELRKAFEKWVLKAKKDCRDPEA